MSKNALAAMSGGVDSSVAAYLAIESGLNVVGATMKLYDNGTVSCNAKTCCSQKDIEDARNVCYKLGIRYLVLNFEADFEKEVIRPFVYAYENGDTPNPCIRCNHSMKFGKLSRRAREMGQDFVVTGHYARIEYDSDAERYFLRKGIDPKKDQSYVLYQMTQEDLAHTLFPLGGMTKPETREIAASLGLVTASKRESQDICFVPDGDYAAFIRRYTGKEYPPGDFVDREGHVLGRHQGLIRYTRGQGRHLGLSLTHRMYVLEKDYEKNQIVLGENEDLFTKDLTAKDMNWIIKEPSGPMKVSARVRYSQKESPATAWPLEAGRMKLEFENTERAITPGQAVVLYDGDYVVGGGTIESV
ncbi:MAG: tRNA 2-thiouridine(34) synthase MnmA [Eubacteriales bacterium]|nr:tRNA 2-thiouridine(34) synthase MnmA [Eubacteriales bacterium]